MMNKSNERNDSGLIQGNSNKDKINQTNIIYKILRLDNSIRLFGNNFVRNNIKKMSSAEEILKKIIMILTKL